MNFYLYDDITAAFSTLTQTSNSGTGRDSSRGAEGVSTTSLNLAAAAALPNTDSRSLDASLAAENAKVLAVLGHFHALYHLTNGGTITGSVFTANSNLD
jgi:hypothetical protein